MRLILLQLENKISKMNNQFKKSIKDLIKKKLKLQSVWLKNEDWKNQ
jgi:hypothetical protein